MFPQGPIDKPLTELDRLHQAARRAQGLAIGAREDRERCEKTLAVLRQKEIQAIQEHWDAQLALERAEARALRGVAA